MGEIRIPLSPGFHAQPGETPGHLHDIYTAVPPLGGNRRVHVGTLSKAAVEAWAIAENERIQALGRLAAARTAITAGASQMTRPVTPITTERGDADGRPLERVRHLKSGTEYEVLGEADGFQIDEYGEPQAHKLVIYRRSDGPLRWMLPAYFNDGRFETIAPASPPASVTGTEGEKPRDRIASVRLLPWEPDSQGGALVTFDSGFKVAVPLYPLEGSARVTVTPAAPSHPGEADRVGLEELERLSAAACPGPWTCRLLFEVTPEDSEFCDALVNAYRAGRLVPASLAALGTGEGSGGASPTGSGSHPSDHAPTDHGRPGFDPSRTWQDISTAPSDDRLILAGCPACAEFPEGRVMIWRASMLNRNQKGPTPHHLSFPATHWAPLLPAPAAGGRSENYRSEYRLAAWLVWFAQKQLAENRDWHARNRLRWAAEALIGEDAVLALGTEAGTAETGTGSVHEGPADLSATPSPLPHPQAPNTLSEVEEARALLEKEKRAYNGNPSEIVKYLRWRSDLVLDDPEMRQELLTRADRIEAALASTEPHASSEEATDAR